MYVQAGLAMPGNWLYPGLKLSILLRFLSNLDSVFEFPIQKNLSKGLGGKSFFRLLGQNDYWPSWGPLAATERIAVGLESGIV